MNLLEQEVASQHWGLVEALTIDKYQGRDKGCVVLSLVRCNARRDAGRLLSDWQRLNVALTRARCKLVLLGSAETLSAVPLFAELLRLVRQRGWYHSLPADALAEAPLAPAEDVSGGGGGGGGAVKL